MITIPTMITPTVTADWLDIASVNRHEPIFLAVEAGGVEQVFIAKGDFLPQDFRWLVIGDAGWEALDPAWKPFAWAPQPELPRRR